MRIIANITENGCRRIQVEIGRVIEDGLTFTRHDFIDLPADDLIGKSEAQVEAMVRKGLAQMEAKHAPKPKAESPQQQPNDALSRVLGKLRKEQT